MLSFLRGGASSFFAMVLIGLLIVSFAVWGIGDVFRMGSSSGVAQIGETTVKPADYARTFQLYYNRLHQQFGEDFTMDRAVQIGLDKRALLDEVTRRTFNEAANELGLRATDDQVRRQIHQTPAFQDSLGQFNKFVFEQNIRYMGYTEKEFLEITRTDITRNNLISAMAGVMQASKTQTELLYKYYNEERKANILLVPASAMPLTQQATAEDLKAYYEENQANFIAPETRAVTYATLRPVDLHQAVEVSEEELREEYENQRDRFTQQEQRSLRQFVLPSKEEADVAAKALSEGEDFTAVAARLSGLGANDLEIGSKTKPELAADFNDNIAASVFSIAAGQSSAPLESDFGWHIFAVDSITAGDNRSFEDVRALLSAEVKTRKSLDHLYDISAKIEDDLAAGVSVSEIAVKHDIPLRKITAMDAVGRGPNGRIAENFPDYIPGFLTTVFSLIEGEEPVLHEINSDGYYILSLDSVTPERQQSYEEVVGFVQELWTSAQKTAAAETLAEDLVSQSKSQGIPLEALKEKVIDGQYASLDIRRNASAEETGLAQELKEALFTADVGAILSLNAPSGDGYIILQVAESKKGDPTADPEGLDAIREQLKVALTNDTLTSYQDYLVKELPVQINYGVAQQVIDQMISRD